MSSRQVKINSQSQLTEKRDNHYFKAYSTEFFRAKLRWTTWKRRTSWCLAAWSSPSASNTPAFTNGSPSRSSSCSERHPRWSCSVSWWEIISFRSIMEWKRNDNFKTVSVRWEPWYSGYGRRLTSERSWVRIPATSDWPFFTFVGCQVVLMLQRPKINYAEDEDDTNTLKTHVEENWPIAK